MKKLYLSLAILFSLTTLLSAQDIGSIKSRLGIVQREKKKKEGRSLQVVGRHYVVWADGISRQEAELVLRHMERILEEYVKLYKYPFGIKKCFIKIYKDKKDFMRVARARGAGDCSGFYYRTGTNNCVVTYNSPFLYSTLSHEALHQFVDEAFGKKPPVWFNEGLASYYETNAFVNDRFITNIVHKQHLFNVKASVMGKKYIELKKLVRMDDDRFYEKNPSLNYAFSWSLVYFLKNKDEEAFKGFVNDIKLGKTFATAVRTNYNAKTNELEKEWIDYIKSLPGG